MKTSGVGEGTSGTSVEVPVVGTLKLSGHQINQEEKKEEGKKEGKERKTGKKEKKEEK